MGVAAALLLLSCSLTASTNPAYKPPPLCLSVPYTLLSLATKPATYQIHSTSISTESHLSINHPLGVDSSQNSISHVGRQRRSSSQGRSRTADRSCYLELYKELLLTRSQCPLAQNHQEAVVEKTGTAETVEYTKNFASPDCGAKIVKHSGGAKNAAHLISRSEDEYVLNECSHQLWFIIELCETIKIVRFETENYELYSGSPHQLQISVAHKFSVNGKNWFPLGIFNSSGERKVVEQFTSPAANVFGKFVKVEVLSNYGDEHFCTMTSFRVYGVSEYEMLEEEEEEDDIAQPQPGVVDVHQASKQLLSESSVEEKLNQISITSSTRRVEKSTNMLGVVDTFKYLYLHRRNDTCIDTVMLSMLQRESVFTQIEQKLDAPKAMERLEDEGAKKEKPRDKEKGGGLKESSLVQLSSRLKTLERNTTGIAALLRQLNLTSTQQASDMDRILEAVLRAKESFKDATKDLTTVRTKVKQLIERADMFDTFVAESTESTKVWVLMVILLVLVILHLVCSNDPPLAPRTRDTATMTTAAPDINVKLKEEELERRLRPNATADPRPRRTTWCGGGSGFNQLPARPDPVVKRIRELQEEKGNPLPMKPPDITSSLHLHEQQQPRRFTSTGLAPIREEPRLDKARLYGEQISTYKAVDSDSTNQILRNKPSKFWSLSTRQQPIARPTEEFTNVVSHARGVLEIPGGGAGVGGLIQQPVHTKGSRRVTWCGSGGGASSTSPHTKTVFKEI